MLKEMIEKAEFLIGSNLVICLQLGIPQKKLEQIKAGKKEPTPYQILKIAELAKLEPVKMLMLVLAEKDLDRGHEYINWYDEQFDKS